MEDLAIATRGLSHHFGKLNAVNQIDLSVPRGCVYGFLGPNGAGKSTTIRLLLGLIRARQGEIDILGQPFNRRQNSQLARIGALVESPSLYGNLTGRENLEVTRRLLGIDKKLIDRALAIVKMTGAADRVTRHYSTGMKQRLGLALALLNQPELLILDEPTNGLDPAGIHEIRDLIRSLPDEYGITVFLSSHLLSEVEQIATHIGIINQGRLIFQGTLQELQIERREHFKLGTFDPELAIELLTRAGYTVTKGEEELIVVNANGRNEAARINRTLVQSDQDVFHMTLERLTLEDIFLKMTESAVMEGALS